MNVCVFKKKVLASESLATVDLIKQYCVCFWNLRRKTKATLVESSWSLVFTCCFRREHRRTSVWELGGASPNISCELQTGEGKPNYSATEPRLGGTSQRQGPGSWSLSHRLLWDPQGETSAQKTLGLSSGIQGMSQAVEVDIQQSVWMDTRKSSSMCFWTFRKELSYKKTIISSPSFCNIM